MLDTNTVSYLLRAHPMVARRAEAAPMASLCISAVTEGELQFGLARRPNAERLRRLVHELLLRLDVSAWTSATARCYGALRADLERIGKPLAPLDLLIAAHAVEQDAVLITNDRAFNAVEGLSLEDWTMP